MTLPVDALYHAQIVEHDRSPRNMGPLPGATSEATVDNPLCGDVVTMRLVIAEGTITHAAFEARSCALCRAAASMLTTQLAGMPVTAYAKLFVAFTAFVEGKGPIDGDLAAFAGVQKNRARRACALLPFTAAYRATRPT